MKKLCLLTVLMAVLTIVCFTSVGCTDKKPAPAIDSASSDSVIADTQAMDSTEQLIEETPMPKAADELFDDFVFNFAANRKLQKSRIVFPLPVYHGKKLTKKIEKNHWKNCWVINFQIEMTSIYLYTHFKQLMPLLLKQ